MGRALNEYRGQKIVQLAVVRGLTQHVPFDFSAINGGFDCFRIEHRTGS